VRQVSPWQRGLGVIGQVGSTLGKLGVNIATFALGRRNSAQGAEAASLVRLDGDVSASILEPIRGIPAVTEARLLHWVDILFSSARQTGLLSIENPDLFIVDKEITRTPLDSIRPFVLKAVSKHEQ
jgi:hypothetical protein